MSITFTGPRIAADGVTFTATLNSATCNPAAGNPSHPGIWLKANGAAYPLANWSIAGTAFTGISSHVFTVLDDVVWYGENADNQITDAGGNFIPDDQELAVANDSTRNLLSIKERIERLIAATVQAIPGIGTVYRWDGRGLRDPATGLDKDASGNRITMKPNDAMVVADDERVAEGGQGDIGSTIKTMPIEVHVKIRQADDDTVNGSQLHNQWIHAVETAVLNNALLQEANDTYGTGVAGQRLANDTQTTLTGQPATEDGQREVISAIKFEIEYEHYRNDPAAGPGITHRYA